jgi:hypothetical protein
LQKFFFSYSNVIRFDSKRSFRTSAMTSSNRKKNFSFQTIKIDSKISLRTSDLTSTNWKNILFHFQTWFGLTRKSTLELLTSLPVIEKNIFSFTNTIQFVSKRSFRTSEIPSSNWKNIFLFSSRIKIDPKISLRTSDDFD